MNNNINLIIIVKINGTDDIHIYFIICKRRCTIIIIIIIITINS